MNPLLAIWDRIEQLLRDARSELPKDKTAGGPASVPVGPLQGTLGEFEHFLDHNELELAWDALAAVADRVGASSACWSKLAQAAKLMQLSDKQRKAKQREAVSKE